MTPSHPRLIPGMPYRLDWSKYHPHNVAIREADRIKAQQRSHDKRMGREADRAKARAADALRMASPVMQDRKAAALATAARMVAAMAPAHP